MDQYQFHVSVFTLIASSRVGGEIEMERWGWLGEKSKHREKSMLGKKACSVKKKNARKKDTQNILFPRIIHSQILSRSYTPDVFCSSRCCAQRACVYWFFPSVFRFFFRFRVFFESFSGLFSVLRVRVFFFRFFPSRSSLPVPYWFIPVRSWRFLFFLPLPTFENEYEQGIQVEQKNDAEQEKIVFFLSLQEPIACLCVHEKCDWGLEHESCSVSRMNILRINVQNECSLKIKNLYFHSEHELSNFIEGVTEF